MSHMMVTNSDSRMFALAMLLTKVLIASKVSGGALSLKT